MVLDNVSYLLMVLESDQGDFNGSISPNALADESIIKIIEKTKYGLIFLAVGCQYSFFFPGKVFCILLNKVSNKIGGANSPIFLMDCQC